MAKKWVVNKRKLPLIAPKPYFFALRDGRQVFVRRFRTRGESPKAYQTYINALVASKAEILADRRMTLAEEKEWVKHTAREIKDGSRVHWVACAPDGTIAASMEAKRGPFRDYDVVDVGVSVAPAFQGQGLGEAVLRTVIADARATLKPRILYLTVLGTNKRAQALYRKLGFRTIGRFANWVKSPSGTLTEKITMSYRPNGRAKSF